MSLAGRLQWPRLYILSRGNSQAGSLAYQAACELDNVSKPIKIGELARSLNLTRVQPGTNCNLTKYI